MMDDTRVVIADDHGLVGEGLCALVESYPQLQVVGQAGDGLEAVRQCRRLSPDLVLMDMMMPGMNGIEAAREICQRNGAVAVIMLSMYSNPEFVYRAFDAGARGYILKRSAAHDLFQAIETVAGGRRFISPQIADSVADFVLDRGAPASELDALSHRERQVLQLIAESHSVAAIAASLNLSQKTVETYRARLYDKLGVKDVPALVRFAIRQGVITLD